MFVDCFSRYTVLVPASNHTADTVNDALLRHVVPYFGTPRRLLSDRGREFIGDVWGKLTHSLGIQRVLTSPYHPEGNSINERSHRTMNNMLRARLLRDLPSRNWVIEIPGIMLALNALVHEPHGFSASMIATGREPSLPPDVEEEACASPSTEDPVAYVEMIRQRLHLTHQQMTPSPAPVATNPYHEDDLIFVMTTPPERTSKLSPRWKGPFLVKRVHNAYQVTYEDGLAWRTVYINHVKPAKTPAGSFPAPLSPAAPPPPLPLYSPRHFTWRKPAPPPQSATPTGESPQPAAPVPEHTQPVAAPSAAPPLPGRPTTRSAANKNLAPHSGQRSTPPREGTNENSRLGQPLRRSARLNPTALCINSRSQDASPHSSSASTMARTFPYSLPYRTCLGRLEDPCSFSSVYLEDLRNGQKIYIRNIQQIINLLPKTTDPDSRFALRAHVTPTGHQRMRDSLRTALWWLLPKDGDFRRASGGVHYYLARQGRCVILRGGNVTSPLHESRLLWLHDPHPQQSPRSPPRSTMQQENKPVPRNINSSVPRNNNNNSSVPRNNSVSNSSDARVRTPLDSITSTTWYNTSLSHPRVPDKSSSVYNPVPRNTMQRNVENKIEPHPIVQPLRPSKKKRINFNRRERRARERREGVEAFIRETRERPGDVSSSSIPDRLTQPGLLHSDPISAMRPAVYPPVTLEGRPTANENSSFHFDQELGESAGLLPGLYKPAVPDPQHHTWANSSAATSARIGPPSPTRNLAASSAGDRTRTGIIYPLQPRSRRPDVCIQVEAALPEPAALLRPDPHPPTREAPTSLPRTSRRLSRKRRRNRSSAIYRPAKRSPPRGHWCDRL